jgi:hypothetical protein
MHGGAAGMLLLLLVLALMWVFAIRMLVTRNPRRIERMVEKSIDSLRKGELEIEELRPNKAMAYLQGGLFTVGFIVLFPLLHQVMFRRSLTHSATTLVVVLALVGGPLLAYSRDRESRSVYREVKKRLEKDRKE